MRTVFAQNPTKTPSAAPSSSPSYSPTTPLPPLEALDQAMLNDLLEQYDTYEDSSCSPPGGSTSFTFDWPGTRTDSNWYAPFVQYEQAMFQAEMNFTDPSGDRSWSIRIGTNGNIYSHYAPSMWGETMAPQNHAEAPWIDEVQQSVAVHGKYNKNTGESTCFLSP